jgi:hypothetical protein
MHYGALGSWKKYKLAASVQQTPAASNAGKAFEPFSEQPDLAAHAQNAAATCVSQQTTPGLNGGSSQVCHFATDATN